ncbi:MAG: hypothetical protein GF329_11370 [Candidatus Lokiarchaeota archaeon]|nr:hypothetical protein [Candidatus Lokiarchaeota archaeon]
MVVISKNYDITVELVELQRKANHFRKERDKYNRLVKEWANKRDKLNTKVGELLNKAQEEKKKRDKLNKKVKKLKKEKQEIKNAYKKQQNIINEIKAEMDGVPPNELKKTMKIRNQIKDLEWKYQTNVINSEQEKSIVDKIYRLEEEIKDKKHILQQLNSLETKINEIKEIQKELKSKQKEIIATADKSQVYHNNMVRIYDEIDHKVRPAADRAHQKFLEMKKIADQFHNDLIMIIPRIKNLRKKLLYTRKDVNKLSNVVESRVEKAMEKMKQGKRLTLDEFQLLVKSGLI